MRKFLVGIFLFFAAIMVIDFAFGKMCNYMNSHSKGGGVKSRFYICKESCDDVFVFGSSRAKHHYVPDIIEDSLRMTCYNTGEDGNGIIFCYGVLKMITDRYTPRMIIYDVSDFDIFTDDNMKYLDLLKAYYDEPGVDSIFWKVKPQTRYMMCSKLYRYNTNCLRIIGNFIRPMTFYPKGYSALYGIMNYEPELMDDNKKEIDSLKIRCFEDFIILAKSHNIKLVCCVSPVYKAVSSYNNYSPIAKMCKKYEIPFMSYITDTCYSDKHLFQDRTHLNDKGACLFTCELMKDIKNNIMLE